MTDKLQALAQRHGNLTRAQAKLRQILDEITPDVTPEAVEAIRGALASVDGAIRGAEREMASEAPELLNLLKEADTP